MERYYNKWFKILVIPAILLFTVVILIPFGMGLAYSFTAWRGSYFKGSEHWWGALVGFKNYIKVFHSQKFMTALIYTLKFTVVAVIFKNVTSLCLAMMVKKIGKGKGVFRTIYFFPNLLGGLAMGFVWSFIFQNVFSLILFGGDSPLQIPFLSNMLQDPKKAVIAMAMMATWQTAGYMMLIYLNGLNNIPEDLYEAASIDGAGKWTQFFKITVPLITPVIFYNLITQLCQAFQEFNGPFLVTKGGPNGATTLISMLIYNNAFLRHKMGMASAQAWILFLITMTMTVVAFVSQKKWVYYSDEDGR